MGRSGIVRSEIVFGAGLRDSFSSLHGEHRDFPGLSTLRLARREKENACRLYRKSPAAVN
ncbi:protein of unknown function [Candidatus Nitrospira inopinata]|uniref:Uncharacterized protein n=1 Tax=Candidatus Nitrospira inopinata TaxID=1715989 RepID=A0A0S4KMW1_9BACT|nr:protein of unknown function [Candidatus Nitrospira inopinata]